MTIIEREREQVQVDVERERRASVLEAAALEIEYRGWCQGKYFGADGEVCMEAAICLGQPERGGISNVYSTFFENFRFDDPNDPCLSSWNDESPTRTAAEVCFVLRWRAQEIRDGR